MKRLYSLAILLALSSASFGQVIINEVLYDPSNNLLDGDANRDGIYDQEGDAFIEFVNSGNSYVDMSGYQIWDDTTVGEMRFEFPAGTILAPGAACVVFGGGTPTGDFGGAIVLVDTSSAGLSLQNSGEVIIVKDANGTPVLTFDSDALSNNPDESYTRNPDITGAFEQHGDNTTRLFSPGRTIDSNQFAVELSLQGIIDFTTPSAGSTGKAIHLVADSAISDLSNYGIGVANNGGGTDGVEYTFPAISASKGDNILVVRDSAVLAAYFAECWTEFDIVLTDIDGGVSQNGDDAIELFIGMNVIETFADINVDGTGEPWEYQDAWAYKNDTGWLIATPNCTDNSENIYYTECRYPICMDVNLSDITVMGEGGATEITVDGGTLQMEVTIAPPYAADTTVVWSVNDENIATIDANGLLTAVADGTVTVTATANDGGGASGTADITISNQGGVSIGVINGEMIRLSPNPATSTLRIISDVTLDQVTIFNLNGQQVFTAENNLSQLNISHLEQGVYIVIVQSGDQSAHMRLIKE